MIAFATCTVEITKIGDKQLGKIWRNMIRGALKPITRAASTYSFFFSASTEARTVRAYCGHSATPMITTNITTAYWLKNSPPKLALKIADTMIATIMVENES